MTVFQKQQIELHFIGMTLGLLAATTVILGSILLAYLMWFDESPPFVSVKARMLDSFGQERYVYRAGEVIQLRRDFCVQRTTPVQIGRFLVNTETLAEITLESSHDIYLKGCAENGPIVALPNWTPAGKWKLNTVVRYSNNPFQEAAVELPPVFLEIIK